MEAEKGLRAVREEEELLDAAAAGCCCGCAAMGDGTGVHGLLLPLWRWRRSGLLGVEVRQQWRGWAADDRISFGIC